MPGSSGPCRGIARHWHDPRRRPTDRELRHRRRAARPDPGARRRVPRRRIPGQGLPPRRDHAAGVGQGLRRRRDAAPGRGVARLLADDGPVRGAVRARVRPLDGGPQRRPRQQRVEREPAGARDPDRRRAGRSAAAARRRGDHRRGRLPDDGQPDRPERAHPGLRRLGHPDLQRRSGCDRGGGRAEDPRDHDRPHPRATRSTSTGSRPSPTSTGCGSSRTPATRWVPPGTAGGWGRSGTSRRSASTRPTT